MTVFVLDSTVSSRETSLAEDTSPQTANPKPVPAAMVLPRVSKLSELIPTEGEPRKEIVSGPPSGQITTRPLSVPHDNHCGRESGNRARLKAKPFLSTCVIPNAKLVIGLASVTTYFLR